MIAAYVAGVTYYGFTAFFEPIINDFNWSYAQISFAASIRGLESGILAPFVGSLIDRFGLRKVVFVGAGITGLGLLLLSHINSLGTFYGVFFLISAGASACTGVMPMVAVGYWFSKKVSIANGIVACGGATSGLLVPIMTKVVDVFTWQRAVVVFGLGVWIICLPLSLLLRHRPEKYGYLPDGDLGRKTVGAALTSIESVGTDIKVGQILKTKPFWHISLGLMCIQLVASATIIHVMPYLSSVNIPRSASSLVASAIPLASILGRLGFGLLGYKFNMKWLTAVGIALVGISMLFWANISSIRIYLVVPFIILFSIGFGSYLPMISGLVREYFGKTRLGTILGIIMGIGVLGSIIGAPLAGWVFDSFGSYQNAWFAFAGVAILGVISLVTTPSIKSMV